MNDKMYREKVDKDTCHQDLELINKGRQLHDEVVLQMCIVLARCLTRPFRKRSGRVFKEREFDYPYENVTTGN